MASSVEGSYFYTELWHPTSGKTSRRYMRRGPGGVNVWVSEAEGLENGARPHPRHRGARVTIRDAPVRTITRSDIVGYMWRAVRSKGGTTRRMTQGVCRDGKCFSATEREAVEASRNLGLDYLHKDDADQRWFISASYRFGTTDVRKRQRILRARIKAERRVERERQRSEHRAHRSRLRDVDLDTVPDVVPGAGRFISAADDAGLNDDVRDGDDGGGGYGTTTRKVIHKVIATRRTKSTNPALPRPAYPSQRELEAERPRPSITTTTTTTEEDVVDSRRRHDRHDVEFNKDSVGDDYKDKSSDDQDDGGNGKVAPQPLATDAAYRRPRRQHTTDVDADTTIQSSPPTQKTNNRFVRRSNDYYRRQREYQRQENVAHRNPSSNDEGGGGFAIVRADHH